MPASSSPTLPFLLLCSLHPQSLHGPGEARPCTVQFTPDRRHRHRTPWKGASCVVSQDYWAAAPSSGAASVTVQISLPCTLCLNRAVPCLLGCQYCFVSLVAGFPREPGHLRMKSENRDKLWVALAARRAAHVKQTREGGVPGFVTGPPQRDTP